MNDETCAIPNVVPLFPLPEVVLFPRALLPLHVFEPRYRELITDALAGEGLVAIGLLKEGFEPLYHTRRAPIHPVICVGRIVASADLDDGNCNVLLRGEWRARVVRELAGRSYRRARVELVEPHCKAAAEELTTLRRKLRKAVEQNIGSDPESPDRWRKLFKAPLPLGDVADVIASGLPVMPELRQCLLTEQDTHARAEMLIHQIHTLGALERNRGRSESTGEWRLN